MIHQNTRLSTAHLEKTRNQPYIFNTTFLQLKGYKYNFNNCCDKRNVDQHSP